MSYQPIVAVGKDCHCGHPMIWMRGQQRCAVYGLHAAPMHWRNRDAPFSSLVDLCMEAPNNTRHAQAMRAKRSGTTLEAAQAVGRHAIGIDLHSRNADLASDRVGMFLEIQTDASNREAV